MGAEGPYQGPMAWTVECPDHRTLRGFGGPLGAGLRIWFGSGYGVQSSNSWGSKLPNVGHIDVL